MRVVSAAETLPTPEAVRRILEEIHAEDNRRSRERVEADPAGHRATHHFPAGASMNYRYWQVHRTPGGARVLFCYATGPNLAGYFLAWRQLERESGSGLRDRFTAHDLRRGAREWARRCSESFDESPHHGLSADRALAGKRIRGDVR